MESIVTIPTQGPPVQKMSDDEHNRKKQGTLLDFHPELRSDPSKKDRIKELVEIVKRHNHLYYTLGTTEITDEEYDRLKEELERLDPRNPLLAQVGAEAREDTKKIEHPLELLSLDKTNTYDEVVRWAKDMDDFVVQPKLDGLAVSIRYEEGRYRYAATRGDGRVGEDITENARFIADIPANLNVNATCFIRGEIYMRRSVFDLFAGEFSNPRNAAAGSVKQKDPWVTGERKLNFAAYSLVMEESECERVENILRERPEGFAGINDEECNMMEMVRLLGIEPAEIARSDLTRLEDIFRDWDARRASELDFEIDGIVIKSNSLSAQEIIGSTHHHPRWAVAWKFLAEQATTRIVNIRWQVSRTGSLTPVADLETVKLAGANISHSTLHNADELQALGVNVGDKVLIERRGDVIPKVIRVLEKGANDGAADIPEKCPRCQWDVVKENVFLKCTNPNCSRRVLRQLIHFADVVDLETVGPSLIEKLINAGVLTTPADFFRLSEEDLLPFDKMGDVLARKIVRNIQRRKSLPASKFLTALGIPHLGEVMASAIAERFGTLGDVMNATKEELLEIDGVGEKIADSVIEELGRKRELIEDFRSLGVAIGEEGARGGSGGGNLPLRNRSFCVTGTLSRPRKYFEDMIVRAGGAVKGMGKGIDYLLAGEKGGSKLEKARKWGIPVVTEKELVEMVGNFPNY